MDASAASTESCRPGCPNWSGAPAIGTPLPLPFRTSLEERAMLEYQHPQPNLTEPSQNPSCVPNLPAEMDPISAQIEVYLDTVCASLTETMSAEARIIWRSEMQAHLEERIAAHREL